MSIESLMPDPQDKAKTPDAAECGGDKPEILPGGPADRDAIGEFIDAYGRRAGVETRSYDYRIERDGRTVAGISAWAMGPDVHVDMLGVDEAERRHGLGSALLEHVERLARRDGCTTASVDTFSFQAPDFYPRHGYEVVFRYPLDDGTERIYFSKRL
jgi:GNAT superfamily N-acetyltransferase